MGLPELSRRYGSLPPRAHMHGGCVTLMQWACRTHVHVHERDTDPVSMTHPPHERDTPTVPGARSPQPVHGSKKVGDRCSKAPCYVLIVPNYKFRTSFLGTLEIKAN